MSDRIRRYRNVALATVLALLLLAWLPALSVAQTPAASDARPAAPETRVPVPLEAAVAPAAPTLAPVPDASTDAKADADATPAPAPAVAIALVLPLDSPTYGRAADAVKSGFAAAATAARVSYRVFPHADGDVLAAFDKARTSGARVIVGPLLRDDVKAVAGAGGELPNTIALNQLDDASALPGRVYTLALSIESEAVQLARRARAAGAQSMVILAGDSPLQKRFAGAFVGEWILLGGAQPVNFRFDRAPEMLTVLKREFARAAPDAVLLAVDAADALLAKPYLGQVTAYASSQVNDRQPRDALRDLDGVTFVETAWLAEPSAPAFAGVARQDYPNAAFDRLYALGIDALRVAQAFADAAPGSLEFDGATGHLALDSSRQFQRTATVLQFRAGEIVRAEPH